MLSYSFLEIIRNKKRSLLLLLVSLLLSAFIGCYFGAIRRMQLRLDEIYQTIPVKGEIRAKNPDKPSPVPHYIIRSVLNTGFIKSADLQVRDYAFIIEPLIGRIISDYEETWPEIIGFYSLDQMPWYNSDIVIEYAEGYSAESFKGSEKICLVSEVDMADHNIKYGDKVRILASNYYKQYSGPEEMEGVLFTVCGQFSTDGLIDGICNMEIPKGADINGGRKGDILVPFNTLISCMINLYDNEIPELELIMKTNIEHVEFIFQNTQNLKDFRSYLSETDFGRQSYEVRDPVMANLEFRIYDDELNEVATPLEHSIKILTNSMGLVLFIIGLIALFTAYLALKSNTENLWIMRSVGRKSSSIFLSMLMELSTPCITACILAYIICRPLLRLNMILPFFYFAACFLAGCVCCTLVFLSQPLLKLLQER